MQVFLAVLVAFASRSLSAQSRQTADQVLRIKGYGTFTYNDPNYGPDKRNLGFTVGGDIDGFRLLPHTDIGLDARYMRSNGDFENEALFAGGPRVSYNAYRFKPYADFLVGTGTLHFNHPGDPLYTHDESRTAGFGAGFDYEVTPYWSFRADGQTQHWHFTHAAPYFHPVQISAGVVYQLHLRGRTGPRY